MVDDLHNLHALSTMGSRVSEVIDAWNNNENGTTYSQVLRAVDNIFEEVHSSEPYLRTIQMAHEESFKPNDPMDGLGKELNGCLKDCGVGESHFASFAIDEPSTIIADDAFAYDATNESIYVLISDPTPWFCHGKIGEGLLEYVMQMTQNIYLPHKLHTMIPHEIVRNHMSMRGHSYQGFVLAINFTIDEKTGEPSLTGSGVFPAKIPRPFVFNYRDMGDIMNGAKPWLYNCRLPPISTLRDYITGIRGKLERFKQWRESKLERRNEWDPRSELKCVFGPDLTVRSLNLNCESSQERTAKTLIAELAMAAGYAVACLAFDEDYDVDYMDTIRANGLDPYIRITNPLRMVESIYNLGCIYNAIQERHNVPSERRVTIHNYIIETLGEDASKAQRDVKSLLNIFNGKLNNVMFVSYAHHHPDLQYIGKVARLNFNGTVKIQFLKFGHVQDFNCIDGDYRRLCSARRRDVEICVALEDMNIRNGTATIRVL